MSATEGLDAAQLRAYFALMEVSGLLEHRVERHLRDAGEITLTQFQILARLRDEPSGRLRMTDLADGIVHSRSGLTYQVGLLERTGYVERGATPHDERSVSVTLTDAGRSHVESLMPGHVAVVREALLAPLSAEDVELLADVLGRVRDAMRCAPPRSASGRRRRD